MAIIRPKSDGLILGPFCFEFHALEEKLLRLALDGAASEGEIQNSAVALIRALRARGVRPEALMRGSELPDRPRQNFEAGNMLMPFGRYRGRPLRSVPTAYLHWCLRTCQKLQPELRAAIHLVVGIRS